MATAYLYGRHSTSFQAATEEVQRKACEGYYAGVLKARGVKHGGWHYDAAVSGGTSFSDRPAGAAVWVRMQPGDYLVVSHLDRAFRSVIDGLGTVEAFRTMGLHLVLLDFQIDTSTAAGEMALTILLAGAQMQRRYISERTRAVMRAKVAAGHQFGRARDTAPIGWMRSGTGITEDPEERRQVEQLAEWKSAGMSVLRISKLVRCSPYRDTMRRRYTKGWTYRSITEALQARGMGYPRIWLNSRQRRSAAGRTPA
jgi:DNA invertase Pin-like site-specific DNA recombinase